jgi:hypothetical protein
MFHVINWLVNSCMRIIRVTNLVNLTKFSLGLVIIRIFAVKEVNHILRNRRQSYKQEVMLLFFRNLYIIIHNVSWLIISNFTLTSIPMPLSPYK